MTCLASPVLAVAIAGLSAAPSHAGDERLSVFTFEDRLDPLGALVGPARLDFVGDTADAVEFGSTSSFGILPLPGDDGSARVMRFDAFTPGQGLRLDHECPPNGVFVEDGYVSNYTIVMDLLWPASSDGTWRSLYNTNLVGSNDGELFIEPASGAIGIGGVYPTAVDVVRPNRWQRIAIVVGAAPDEGQLQKYIDGNLVGGQGTTGSGIDARWALYGNSGANQGFVILNDDDGETAAGYLANVSFVDRRLSQAEVLALGGPGAAGVLDPGPPPVPFAPGVRRVGIIAHRGDSAQFPENTLVAMRRAYDVGADAIEVDVRLTGDGVAVLMHDSTLDRTTDLTGPVTETTAATLAASADAGGWFDDRHAGEPVPTLAEALALAEERGRILFTDTKVSGVGAAYAAAFAEAGADPADHWIWTYDEADRLEIRSFLPDARFVSGEVPATGRRFDELRKQGVIGFDLSLGQLANADEFFFAEAEARDLFVSCYTVLDPDTMLWAIERGVDAMETDFPAILDSIMAADCPADLDGDGEVGGSDVGIMLAGWGTAQGDLDGDGDTDGADFGILLAAFGDC